MPDKITKAELIEILASRTNQKQKNIHSFINSFFAELIKSLLLGNTIELRGFGTFELKKRKGRVRARNPKTGEIVSVPDHGAVHFRPGRDLKNEAWGKYNT